MIRVLPLLFASLLAAQPYRNLKYPPLKEVKIPEIATFTLANGMKLYLVENHELPLVSGFALVRTGNLLEPADKVGLAEVTGMVMRTGGTKAKTGDELDELLENMAATVETAIGETNGSVSFSALKENIGEVLAVFKDVLTAPEFRQEKLDLAKTQVRSLIARRNDDPGGIAAREFADIVYGKDTPYGRRIEYATLDSIRREDLSAFYQRYFFPANILIAVQGDFPVAEMKSRLEKLFGDWNYQQPPVPPFPPVRQKPVPGVYLATKTDVTQTFFQAGHLGGTLRDKDFPALQVMADILGGGFTSRLFKKVRTELGYAYDIDAVWGAAYQHPGLLRISGSTKSASATETLRVIREEVERIRSAEVGDEELASAKDKVLNSFVFNFDRPSKTLNRLVTYDYYGYPKDFIFQYQKAVAAVTKADVLRVAREHLKPESFMIVAVGNPKEFGQPLAALTLPVEPIDLSIPEPKREPGKADASSLEKGRQLLERVRQALGGAAKLAAVKDLTQSAEVDIQTPGGAMKAKQLNRWLAPSVLRQESDLPFGKLTTFFDGKTGWLTGPQGAQPLPEEAVKQVQMELFRMLFRLVLNDRVNYIESSVLEISDQQGRSVRLHVDETTGMPVKQVYQSGGLVEESYSDWREVDGIRVPFKRTILQGGRKFADITVKELKFNTGLKTEELSQKP